MMKKLHNPPEEERAKELWLQNALGLLIFENTREYAIERIPNHLSDGQKEIVINGINDAVYGMLMMLDGVTENFSNDEYTVKLASQFVLEKNSNPIMAINSLDSDGMCMGFHDWLENDFGDAPIIRQQ